MIIFHSATSTWLSVKTSIFKSFKCWQSQSFQKLYLLFPYILFFLISKTIIFKENLIKYSWIPWGWDQVDEVVSPLLLVSPDRDTDWTQRMEKLHNFSSYHSLNKSSEVIKNLFLWLLQEGSKLFMFILLSPVWKYEKYWNMKMKRIVNQISSRE